MPFTHLTPISRHRNQRHHDHDESPEGRPGDQIDKMKAMMMMNLSADREERRSDREERRKEFRLQLEMQRQQMQAQQNMMAMVMMSMLGGNAAAAPINGVGASVNNIMNDRRGNGGGGNSGNEDPQYDNARTKTLPPRLLRGNQRDVRHVDLASDGQRCKEGALVLADNVDEFSNN